MAVSKQEKQQVYDLMKRCGLNTSMATAFGDLRSSQTWAKIKVHCNLLLQEEKTETVEIEAIAVEAVAVKEVATEVVAIEPVAVKEIAMGEARSSTIAPSHTSADFTLDDLLAEIDKDSNQPTATQSVSVIRELAVESKSVQQEQVGKKENQGNPESKPRDLSRFFLPLACAFFVGCLGVSWMVVSSVRQGTQTEVVKDAKN